MEPEDQVSLTVPVINKIKFTLCLADVLFELYQPFHLQLAWDLYFCVVQIPGNGVFSETLQSGQQQIFKLQMKMEIPHRSAKKQAAYKAAAKSKQEQIIQGDELLVKSTGLKSGRRAEYVNRIWFYIQKEKLVVTPEESSSLTKTWPSWWDMRGSRATSSTPSEW